MSWTSKYFSYDEMKCKCGCGEAPMDNDFMYLLDSIREGMGKPLYISSGYRCANHPIEKKKLRPGAHSTGKAADLLVDGEDAQRVLLAALLLEFNRIGIQQKGSGRFIHLDTATEEDGFPAPALWSY